MRSKGKPCVIHEDVELAYQFSDCGPGSMNDDPGCPNCKQFGAGCVAKNVPLKLSLNGWGGAKRRAPTGG